MTVEKSLYNCPPTTLPLLGGDVEPKVPMVLSPSLMHTLPPCLKVCFSSSGSSMGSTFSPMFSRSTGVPNWMQFSSVRTKSGLVSLMTWRFLHVLDPLVDLALGVYHQWPSTGIAIKDDMLHVYVKNVQNEHVYVTHTLFEYDCVYVCTLLSQSIM